MPQQARWVLPDIPEAEAAAFAKRCGMQMPAARVLFGRGFRDATAVEHFYHPKLTDLHDPLLMLGMGRAVDRVFEAVAKKERVLIYGDYDVDGVSSVVILKKMLELLGVEALFHVPDRLKDGYGISQSAIDAAAASGVHLLISVDTGIRAQAAVRAAAAAGIDVIITDHHLPEADLPAACAILNPNQPGCPYPNKHLCGAGVTFKLIQALMGRAGWAPDRIVRFVDSFLILVAVATVADVVPLTGENRILVKRGLEGLSKTKNPGLRAMLEISGLPHGEPLSAGDVGFRIAPRINAAGRMDNARDAIEMLLTADENYARAVAGRLDELNAERQRTGEAIVQEIVQHLLERGGIDGLSAEEAGLVFYSPEWHRGVVGIVASRIVEQFHRPVLVLGLDERTGHAQGSGRSIPGFHLLDALDSMSDVFVRYGGHRQAVGLTLEAPRVAELKERFRAAAMQVLSAEDLQPECHLDAEMRLEELTDAAAAEVIQLAPFGFGNREPSFLVRGATLAGPPEPLGRDGKHLKFFLQNGGKRLFVKAWRMGARAGELQMGTPLDVALSIEPDTYSQRRGFSPWGATVRDFRAAGPIA